MIKTIKYRLYPTKSQKALINKTFGCCTKLWNLMLEDSIAYYQASHQLLELKVENYFIDYPYLKDVDRFALYNVVYTLNRAYKNFFKQAKCNHPKFKSFKTSKKSYTTRNRHNQIDIVIDDNSIKLPIIGKVNARIHRKISADWGLKFVNVTLDSSSNYYASIAYSYDLRIIPAQVSDKVIGLDYKSDGLYCDSEGYTFVSPKYYRKSQKKLAILQHRLNAKQEGSANWEKAQLKLAKLQRHISNQRNDYLHKESRRMANSYDAVCCESLDMKVMANKNFGIGKSTYDNGYGLFLYMLEYKLKEQGKQLIKIDRWYPSSQICSRCGNRIHIPLYVRIFRCPCGLVIDRDYNSALNIKREGLRMLKILK